MSKLNSPLQKYPSLKIKQQKKIMIEELMFSQMQASLGRSIVDYVDETRQSLQHVGIAKTRKIVLAVEKNLNKFMRGSYQNKFRLASDFYSNVKINDKTENFPTSGLFSSKLLNKELQKMSNHPHVVQEQGALRRHLISANRISRGGEAVSTVIRDRKNQCYSAKHNRRNESVFSLIGQK